MTVRLSKQALVIGITGQDGPLLAKHLLALGYDVYGLIRNSSHRNLSFLKEMDLHEVKLLNGDLCDNNSLSHIFRNHQFDEVYNLGGISNVSDSFEQPEYTSDVNGLGVLRLLENIRIHSPSTKLFQAGSSEMFGDTNESPQNENSKFNPTSPYGIAKLFAYNMCKLYREKYKLFICNGIMYNHISTRQDSSFVISKISKYLANAYVNGYKEPLLLGNVDSRRDWSNATEIVAAMPLMMNHHIADDYILCSGYTHSIKEVLDIMTEYLGCKIVWQGQGKNAQATDMFGQVIVKVDQKYYKPINTKQLVGDWSKAYACFNWAAKWPFEDSIENILICDINRCKRIKNDNSKNKTDYQQTA